MQCSLLKWCAAGAHAHAHKRTRVRRHCCGWRGAQVIYDLLVKSSGPLELREDPDQGMCVAGLKHISVNSAAEIMASGNCMHAVLAWLA